MHYLVASLFSAPSRHPTKKDQPMKNINATTSRATITGGANSRAGISSRTANTKAVNTKRANSKPDAEVAWKQFEDHLIPTLRLSAIDRAVYSHLFRHSRLEGKRQLQSTGFGSSCPMLDWTMAEFVRLHHGVSSNEAQVIVDALVTRQAPVVQEFSGFLKVLNPALQAGDHVLLVLYHRGTDGASYQD